MGKVTDTTGANEEIIELSPPPCFIFLFARSSSNPAEQATDLLFSLYT